MKSVCFVSLYSYPLFNPRCKNAFGGSEVQIYQLANKINKKHDISYIVGDFGQKPIEVYNNIKVYKSFSLIRKGVFKHLIGVINLLKLFLLLYKTSSDIYIQRAAGLETFILSIFCRLNHKSFIYMTASSIDTNGKYRKLNHLEGFFYEWGLNHANKIICQSQNQKEQLKITYGLDSTIIKNSFFIPQQIITSKKYILWASSSQILKQPQIFIDLVKKLPSQKFIMIMPKNDLGLWKNIFLQSKSLSNLTFIEQVPFFKIDKYFKGAKLFLNTSIYEGFPNTFVQAAMYGTPIISLSVNPDNFLNKNHCGFCADNNIGKFYRQTTKLLTDNKLWFKMSQNSYTYTQKFHNININIKKFEKLLV